MNKFEEKEFSTSLPDLVSSIPHLVGIRTEEEPTYFVLEEDGDKQIRDYKPFFVAQTTMEGLKYDEAMETGFLRLANYFFAKNYGERSDESNLNSKDAQFRSTKMSMTSPVLHLKEGANWKMAFVIPNKYTAETIPVPVDTKIKIIEVPERVVAVVKFSGRVDEIKMQEKARELEQWIQSRRDFYPCSLAMTAQYDPPATLPFLRRNEIQIEIKKQESGSGSKGFR